jgi:uncharacterized protein YbbK (DUF523 family)/uncharacterized protein YbgA (DUF1722 family)
VGADAPLGRSGDAGGGLPPDDAPIRIGVSSCLLGREVRWDGGHMRDRFLTDVLARFVEWVPVCPELELGLGVPREPIRLVRRGREVRLVAERSGTDHTAAMRRFAERRVRQLEALDLCGYVLKNGSPSCGMERVRVGRESGGRSARTGRGAFAAVLRARLPLLPVVEEGRLCDAGLRERWIERVFAYHRLRSFFDRRWSAGGLVRFHRAHELQLLAHAPDEQRALGRLVAGARRLSRPALRRRYEDGFMRALARRATCRRHANALRQALGHFRGRLDPASRAELRAVLEGYRRGLVPLVVPLSLVRHHVRALGVETLAGQVYLEPHPKERMLRNHL